jgi:transposase
MASGTVSRRARRRFSEEFKAGAIRLVLDEGKTVGAVARELDLTASSLGAWVRQAEANRSKGKTGLTTAEREELSRLRKENRELRLEREILKNGRAPRHLLLDQKLRGEYLLGPGSSGRRLSGALSPLKNMVRGGCGLDSGDAHGRSRLGK